MPKQSTSSENVTKGLLLELRVARLLFAEGMTPYVNVYFPKPLEPRTVTTPDIDVMGCRLLPDASLIYTHYDCKSGDSDVVGRILLLLGMRERIPEGPIVYIRRQARLDIKLYALQHGIRLTSLAQLNEREQAFVEPLFGEEFPSVSDIRAYSLWQATKTSSKRLPISRVLRYFDGEFWTEQPFTRLRRTIAAVSSIFSTCAEAGIADNEQSLLVACVLRRFIYALLTTASYISCFTDQEIETLSSEWLITEDVVLKDYNSLVENVAQFVFNVYGDPKKGPLQKQDYSISPPDYTAELVALLRKTIRLHDDLPWVLNAFDALAIEGSIFQRPKLTRALLRGINAQRLAEVCRWYRAVRLFLGDRNQHFKDWEGWSMILAINDDNSARKFYGLLRDSLHSKFIHNSSFFNFSDPDQLTFQSIQGNSDDDRVTPATTLENTSVDQSSEEASKRPEDNFKPVE